MDERKIGVHASHCCALHGCKYGDDDCPVVSGQVKQKYLCEVCSDQGIKSFEELYMSMAGVIPTCSHCGAPSPLPLKRDNFNIEVLEGTEGRILIAGTLMSMPTYPCIELEKRPDVDWRVVRHNDKLPSGIIGAEEYAQCFLAAIEKSREIDFKRSMQKEARLHEA